MVISDTIAMKAMKIGFCGTHPYQYNGYSRVAFELTRRLAAAGHEVHYFGFQNYYGAGDQRKAERDVSGLASVFDAHEEEKKLDEDQRTGGFGDNLVRGWAEERGLDVVVIYNDLLVLSRLLGKLRAPDKPSVRCKIVAYVDLVYRFENEALLNYIRNNTDAVVAFTQYWADELTAAGFGRVFVAEHGFSDDVFKPLPKSLARAYVGLPDEDFLILNLNRNQPRKRLDVCMEGFVLFVKGLADEPVRARLVLGCETNRGRGAWDLLTVLRAYCRKHGADADDMAKRVITLNQAHRRTDRDINALYNSADVGINTAEGEGFGLCSFEGAGLGVPQVASAVGGVNDFLTKNTAIMLAPKWGYYVTRDGVGGEAQVCSAEDVAQGLAHLYANRATLKSFGKRAAARVKEFTWDRAAGRFAAALAAVAAPEAAAAATNGADQVEGTRLEITHDTGALAAQIEQLQAQLKELTARVKEASSS